MSLTYLLIAPGISFLWLPIAASADIQRPDEAVVAAGAYYTGPVFGAENYPDHSNTSLQAFSIMKTEVTYRLYHAVKLWADRQGFAFSEGCNGTLNEACLAENQDEGRHPVTTVSWWDALLFANALSTYLGMEPYYLAPDGKALKKAPDDNNASVVTENHKATGYRLPTFAEWQVAARGGDKGLANGTYGSRYAGSNDASRVAHFPAFDSQKSGTAPVASYQPNALGLYDMSGNVSEWLNDGEAIEGAERMSYFCGGSFLEQTNNLAECDLHSPGFVTPDTGFRLVRSLYAQ